MQHSQTRGGFWRERCGVLCPPLGDGSSQGQGTVFTGDKITAEEAKALGMVNHVVPERHCTTLPKPWRDELPVDLSMGLRLAKQSVNQAQDAQGFGAHCRAQCPCSS